jgi:hypothetical protein
MLRFPSLDVEQVLVWRCNARRKFFPFVFIVASKVALKRRCTTTYSESPMTAPVSDHDNPPGRKPRKWTDSVFQELAEGVVETGMAHDITEAYALVILGGRGGGGGGWLAHGKGREVVCIREGAWIGCLG